MDRDTTFKEHYFWEMQRRDSLNSSISFPVGIATLLFGALYTMSKAVTLDFACRNLLLVMPMAVALICLSVSVFFSAWAYRSRQGYAHAPHTAGLHKTKKGLENYYIGCGKSQEEAKTIAHAEFLSDLDAVYAENGEINGKANDKKAKRILVANEFIIYALIFVALSGLIFFFQSKTSQEEPIKIQVTNLEGVAMSDNKPTSPPPKAPPTQQTVQPVKPAMPPSRLVQDGYKPPISKK
ncbi:hypothetical protein KCU57_15260 [Xanthomonas translucens]|uniref:hypothetical protein n=1 Tax=Xanthomonas campestris pv. translucens TaxID=343 RepID=UPI001F35BD59|nr:hypothetical protein [Xanthomonas translucens]UKE50056.1 hypothetical protein KCU57_15260 [Xanthomonas translucens]